jgi:hypothetical protein
VGQPGHEKPKTKPNLKNRKPNRILPNRVNSVSVRFQGLGNRIYRGNSVFLPDLPKYLLWYRIKEGCTRTNHVLSIGVGLLSTETASSSLASLAASRTRNPRPRPRDGSRHAASSAPRLAQHATCYYFRLSPLPAARLFSPVTAGAVYCFAVIVVPKSGVVPVVLCCAAVVPASPTAHAATSTASSPKI